METKSLLLNYFEANVGGYFGESYRICMERNQSSGQYEVYAEGMRLEKKSKEFALNASVWQQLESDLDECKWLQWKEEYFEFATDGTQWEIIVGYEDGDRVVKSGSNDFPPEWKAFCKSMQRISGGKFA